MTPERRRVVMITRYYLPSIGGVQRHVADLATSLSAAGIEVHVLTEREGRLPPFERINGVNVHRLSRPFRQAIGWPILALKYLALIKRLQPDLIHAHRISHSSSTIAILAKYLLNVPLVVTAHTTGRLSGDVARVKRQRYRKVYSATLRRAVDKYIAVSQEANQELAGLQIPAERRTIIANGVDTTYFKPLPPEDRSGLRDQLHWPPSLHVIYTGRLSSEKRVNRLIDSWPRVLDRFPTARLVIVGVGPEAAALKRLAGSNIHFIGGVDDVRPYLQAADIFVLVSVVEGLSLSLLEAMSTGLPVIVTAIGGAPDVIVHGHNGWLIPPDDPTALHAALLTLLADADLRDRLGRAARERVVADNSLMGVTTKTRAVYDQVWLQDEHK